jgi:AcrR family transcriptional regulator
VTKGRAPERRLGTEESRTRATLVEAALALMLEAGYPAVTSRRVAAKAGLKPQLVHYYFRSMDDLLLAVFRYGAERNLERQARALASPTPLRSLWEFSNDPTGTAVMMEFMALANHRPAIRAEIASYAERFRRLQAEALGDVLRSRGVDLEEPPLGLLVLMTALSRVLMLEGSLGATSGHAEAIAMVESFLDRYEAAPHREQTG